jgi:hypothetical protein
MTSARLNTKWVTIPRKDWKPAQIVRQALTVEAARLAEWQTPSVIVVVSASPLMGIKLARASVRRLFGRLLLAADASSARARGQ